MEEQTTAFGVVPEVATPTADWTCTQCGNDDQRRLRIEIGRPSLDPGYALGYCDDCGLTKRTVKGPKRDTRVMIESRRFDREAFLARAREQDDAKLLGRFRRGHLMTKDEIERIRAIQARLDRDQR